MGQSQCDVGLIQRDLITHKGAQKFPSIHFQSPQVSNQRLQDAQINACSTIIYV